MNRRYRLRAPIRGVSKDLGAEDQHPLTTPRAANVRAIVPDNGRTQLAQRAGYRDFLSEPLAGGARVDALASVTVDLPKIQFFGPNGSTVEEVWDYLTASGFRALDVATDFDGNVYAVDPSGIFVMLGADGQEARVTTFYVEPNQSVVPRIEVDEDGAVYVASSHKQGYSSNLFRFERTEREDGESVYFSLGWTVSGTYGITDFRVRAGVLAAARYYSKLADQLAPADVLRYTQLGSTEPFPLEPVAVPWPVSTIAINDAGEILGCSPENPKRNEILGDEGWNTPVTAWSPHELEDPGGSGASKRIHFWISAKTLSDDHVDGTPIRIVPDRRWLHTTLDFSQTEAIDETDGALSKNDQAGYAPVLDTTARPLRNRVRQEGEFSALSFGIGGLSPFAFDPRTPGFSSDLYIERPTFRPNGAGTLPTIRFPGIRGASLQTKIHTSNTGNKSDTDGDGIPNDDGVMPKQHAIFPTHEKRVFATFLLIRWRPNDTHGGVVFHHRTKAGVDIALIVNADEADVYGLTPGAATSGSLTLYVAKSDYQGTASVADASGTGGATNVDSCELTSADFDNPQNVALICIQHAGSTHADGPSSAVAKESMFRVNGRVVDRFTFTEKSTGAYSTMFGSTEGGHLGWNWVPGGPWDYGVNTSRNLFSDFEGDVLECITILGRTASATLPNEEPVGFPTLTGGPDVGLPPDKTLSHQWTDMGAENYVADPIAYTNAASEIERMEGWMAYDWGCANILTQSGTTGTPVNGLEDEHPFCIDAYGVTGNVYPVGSAAAGAEIISEVGAALRSPKELLYKIGSTGQVAWALAGGGHGLGVQSGPNQSVYAVGLHDTAAPSTVVAKKVLDAGSSVVTTGDETWELEETLLPSKAPVYGMRVDASGKLYWPRRFSFPTMRLEITADPLSAGTDTLTITTTGGGSEDYVAQFVGGLLSNNDAFRLPSPQNLAAAAANLAAAINDDGDSTFPVTPATQYSVRANGAHPDVRATVELEGSQVFLRLTRKTVGGTVTVSKNAGWAEIEFEDDAAATSMTLGEGFAAAVEVRGSEEGGLLWRRTYGQADDEELPLAIALNPILPLYNDEDLDGTAEHLYVAFQNDSKSANPSDPAGPTVRKYAHVERRQVIDENLSPRRTVHVGTAGGNVYRLQRGLPPVLVGGGVGAFQLDSPFTKFWVYRQKVYGLDGQRYVRYDPKSGLLEEWKAEGAGEIPFGAKLACVFNQRIVLSRTPDDPHNLHMSGRGEPDDWNTNPDVLTPLSAFSGAGAGNLHFRSHDLVNCLIPARDDLLYVGGDRSLSRLTGDPGGQGQLDNISQLEGVAFGDAYAVGPGGTVFIKGVNTGIWRLGVAGSVDSISDGWIERELQDIDLSRYDVEMQWSFRQRGLHVYVVPKGAGLVPVASYFWDSKNGGWWPDTFSAQGRHPTCSAIFDGDDPGDRGVMIGCEDGQVRVEDEDELNDGGSRIVSECWFGPLVPEEAEVALFTALEASLVALPGYSGAQFDVFTAETPDYLGGEDPVASAWLEPGYRGKMLFTARGNQVWVRIRNAAQDQKWALTSLFARARTAGARRM